MSPRLPDWREQRWVFWCFMFMGSVSFLVGCRHVHPNAADASPPLPSVQAAASPAQPGLASEFHDLSASLVGTGGKRHYLCTLNIGDDALLARIHMIRSAHHTIDWQTYIWVNDESGRYLFEELLAAARRGVRVRLLDDQFTVGEDSSEIARMGTAHPNFTLKFFRPLSDRASNRIRDYATAAMTRFRRINRRMHNKILVVDGKIGMVGGRNVQNKYFDRDDTFVFKDRDCLVIGPCVEDMNRSFEEYWTHSEAVDVRVMGDVLPHLHSIDSMDKEEQKSRASMPMTEMFTEVSKAANRYSIISDRSSLQLYTANDVEFVSDPPEKPSVSHRNASDDVASRIRALCLEAENTILFQSPYLVMSRNAYRAVRRAQRRTPALRWIFSSNGLGSADHVHVYAISWKQRRRVVQKLGGEVYQLKPNPADAGSMVPLYAKAFNGSTTPVEQEKNGAGYAGPRVSIHAKSLVVDSRAAYVGSYNFDPRSFRYNTECGLVVRDEMFARSVQADIFRDIAPPNSWMVAERRSIPVISLVNDWVGRFFAALPICDVWPFRSTACFELKPGKAPLSAGHDDFFDHYQEVGQFPGMKSWRVKFKTHLIKAMGGLAAPLM